MNRRGYEASCEERMALQELESQGFELATVKGRLVLSDDDIIKISETVKSTRYEQEQELYKAAVKLINYQEEKKRKEAQQLIEEHYKK